MIRKTALLTGIAGAFLFAAPVLAQDATTSQTPEPAAAEATAAQPRVPPSRVLTVPSLASWSAPKPAPRARN
jgi:hypothetical protein